MSRSDAEESGSDPLLFGKLVSCLWCTLQIRKEITINETSLILFGPQTRLVNCDFNVRLPSRETALTEQVFDVM